MIFICDCNWNFRLLSLKNLLDYGMMIVRMIGQLVLDQAYKKVKQRNFEHFQQTATEYGI